MRRIKNKGFIATSILFGIVALLFITFAILMGNSKATLKSDRLYGYMLKSDITNMSGIRLNPNGGTIKNNTTRKADFKNAGLFVQSDVKIGLNMTVEDKVVLRGADAELNNNGTIAGDVELVDNLGTFNNNGSVTGNIIVPQP